MLAKLVPAGTSEPLPSVGVQHVAVKKLALDGAKDDTRVLGSLARELDLLKSLSHENIVKPIGFVEDAKDGIAWIILPWENNGNLREFLQSADWEFQERVALIHDVAKGINYLHDREPPMYHGNLKSLNVILNPKNKAVITDFGSALCLESVEKDASEFQGPSVEAARHPNAEPPKVQVAPSGGTITLTGPRWVLSWTAPELQSGRLSDLTSDIWAFGWICWETLTSDFPLNGEDKIPVVLQTVEGKLPQGQSEGRPEQVKALTNLMVDCWSLDPSKRPTASLCESQVGRMERKTPWDRNRSGSPEVRSSRLLTALAVEHSGHGGLEQAVDLFSRATNIARSTKDGMAMAHAAHMLGMVYRSQRKYSKAEESYVAARDIYARVGNQDSLADATYGLGEVYCLQDKYSKAEEVYIEARDIYTRIGDRIGLANAVYGLGEAYRLRGEPSKAEESYFAARDIYAEIGEQLSHANTVRALGEVYRLRGESSKAVECYVAARDIYARSEDQEGLAHTTKALGDVHYLRREYSTAEESYSSARDIYAGIENQLGFATAVKALGDVYRFRGESSKAEESYITARKINAEMGNQLALANVIRALGDIYRLQGESSKAEESYVAARDIYTQLGDQNGLANTITALGQLYAKQGDHTRAEQLYQEAQSIYAKIGSRYSLANSLLYIGWLYRDQKRYEEAEGVVSKALAIFEELGLETYRLDCEEFLAIVREKKPKSWKIVLKAFLS
ncbi:hypothetical protein FS837_007284 [Tulasnella sp. UAMH 9824]|nr:hypothetical protein FS837_007284 [Tulasnella sp. UAMH 9824]